jgi:hypothetical protein
MKVILFKVIRCSAGAGVGSLNAIVEREEEWEGGYVGSDPGSAMSIGR